MLLFEKWRFASGRERRIVVVGNKKALLLAIQKRWNTNENHYI